MNIDIRKISRDDLNLLVTISRETFSEAFASVNTPENMDMYLNEKLSAKKLASELIQPGSAFYFAYAKGNICGYMKLNTGSAQTDLHGAPALEIERIYILKQYRGRKIGQRLLAFARSIAESHGADYIWLGVWENNTAAIRFYTRHGFIAFGQHPFMLGNDRQTDILMKLDLSGTVSAAGQMKQDL